MVNNQVALSVLFNNRIHMSCCVNRVVHDSCSCLGLFRLRVNWVINKFLSCQPIMTHLIIVFACCVILTVYYMIRVHV